MAFNDNWFNSVLGYCFYPHYKGGDMTSGLERFGSSPSPELLQVLKEQQVKKAAPDMLREMKKAAKVLEDVAELSQSFYDAIAKAEGRL